LFLGRGFLNTVHAEAQAVWDLRRMLGWIRAQGASTIGVFGVSLGGYTAALLAAFESELAPLIAGIPATDLIALVRRNHGTESRGGCEEDQIPWGRIGEVLRVVSPLAMPAKVPPERCVIFAGAVDRLVPPDQALALWQHWKKPRLVWYAGGHISQHWEPEVRQLQREVLRQMMPGAVALD
jgi:pimeloyl-ACP methyl ester carboxylesterase